MAMGKFSDGARTRVSRIIAVWPLIALFAPLTMATVADDQTTAAQLDRIVDLAKTQSDKEAAKQINSIIIGERIGAKRLERLAAELPGEKSRSALTAIADASEFLDLPAKDVPNLPPPSIDDQRKITVKAVQVAADTLHRMPNFFATRSTSHYQRMGPEQQMLVLGKSRRFVAETAKAEPFRQIERTRKTVVYRDGKEMVEGEPAPAKAARYGAENRGEFGEFLKLIIADMIQSQIRWSHWENGDTGLLAVFSFEVPKDRATYRWTFCCIPSKNGEMRPVENPAAYDAEIAIEPGTGNVLRIVVNTRPEIPAILKASEVLEYGRVVIAGSTCVCPLRNIVLYSVRLEGSRGFGSPTSPETYAVSADSDAHYIFQSDSVAINHTTFENYHMFGSNMRIVPDNIQAVPVEP